MGHVICILGHASTRAQTRIAKLISGLAILTAVTSGTAAAGNKVFLLDEKQLNSVTASGFVYVADTLALANGVGINSGLTDTITTSSVNPEDASALASGLASGPDGSNVSVSAVIFGEKPTDVVVVSSTGDTLVLDGTLLTAIADGTIRQTSDGFVAEAGALTEGGDGLTLSSASFQNAQDSGTVSGTASSDGFSQRSPSESSSKLQFGSDGTNLSFEMSASGSGDTDGAANVTSTFGLTEGSMSVNGTAGGEAVGQQSTVKSSQVVKIGKFGMFVRNVSRATSSFKDGVTTHGNITVDGAPTDAVRSTQRTIRLNGMSRSISTTIIDFR